MNIINIGTVINFLAVPLVAMEGYSSKFTIFAGVTPPHKHVNMVAVNK
jgi:hypothetical protein